MNKRQILLNALMSLLQIGITGISLFVLYRFLLNTIGIEQLGIWSVVLATSSVAAVARIGLSGSAVKYVARYLALGEAETVSEVIQTTVVSIGLFSGVMFLVAYPFARFILGLILPEANLETAYSLLPYALLSLWIMVVSSVFYSGIDGFQRIDLRSAVLIGGTVFQLLLAFLLVPSHGLMGLAYAQVAQSAFIFLGSFVMLRRLLPALPLLPSKWSRRLFKEMIGYGVNFQVISISQMLYDPVTKALLTKFGGLALTGFYEMANRMVVQLRTLLVAANQVLVPTMADLQERNSEKLRNVYRQTYRLMLYIALPFFSAIVIFTPLISKIWIGHYEQSFVLFSIILCLGWFVNTLAGPAYFANLGIGELKWNTVGHVSIGVLNFVLCFIFGKTFGGPAVVAAWVVSLMVGSLLIPVAYHYRHGLPFVELLPREHIFIGSASLMGVAANMIFYLTLGDRFGLIGSTLSVFTIFFAFVAYPVWAHPVRGKITGWITESLLHKF